MFAVATRHGKYNAVQSDGQGWMVSPVQKSVEIVQHVSVLNEVHAS